MMGALREHEPEPSGAIDVSLDEWPLVLTHVRDGFTIDDFVVLNRVFDGVLARRERFVSITDLRGLHSIPSSAMRTVITSWKHANDDAIRRYNAAGAVIIDSVLARAALRAVQWVAPHPAPYAVVATPEEARAFCLPRLAPGFGESR